LSFPKQCFLGNRSLFTENSTDNCTKGELLLSPKIIIRGGEMMDKDHLKEFYITGKLIKFFLKKGAIFTGSILLLGETSLILLDKYQQKVPLSYDCISHVQPIGGVD